jgi:hypothetical protein
MFIPIRRAYIQCRRYSRIRDLESRVKILKKQIITALDKAQKSAELEAKVSLLEAHVSSLSSKIADLSDIDRYMIEFVEEASKKLQCKFRGAPKYFLLARCTDAVTCDAGTCLDAAVEKVRVDKRVAVLGRITDGLETFWSDARKHHAIVLLQDRTDQIRRTMETC